MEEHFHLQLTVGVTHQLYLQSSLLILVLRNYFIPLSEDLLRIEDLEDCQISRAAKACKKSLLNGPFMNDHLDSFSEDRTSSLDVPLSESTSDQKISSSGLFTSGSNRNWSALRLFQFSLTRLRTQDGNVKQSMCLNRIRGGLKHLNLLMNPLQILLLL